MARPPDHDLLAVRYLRNQDAGGRLRDLARMVATYRHHNAEPGRRSARKAGLGAAAKAAARLRTALGRIDPRTQLEAFETGAALRASGTTQSEETGGPASPRTIGQPDYQSRLADVLRLTGALEVIAAGFGAMADRESVSPAGGRPLRHDALQMGLEGLLGLWRQYRPDAPPDQSRNEGSFLAFAWDVFATGSAPFDRGTIPGAVIDLLRQQQAEGVATPAPTP